MSGQQQRTPSIRLTTDDPTALTQVLNLEDRPPSSPVPSIGDVFDEDPPFRHGKRHSVHSALSEQDLPNRETSMLSLKDSHAGSKFSDDDRQSRQHTLSVYSRVSYDGASPMPNELFEFDIGGCTIHLSYEELRSYDLHSKLAVLVRNTKFVLNFDSKIMRLSGHKFFIERPPSEAKIVFYYYKTGRVKKPRNQCEMYFLSVLAYWGLPPSSQYSTENAHSASLLHVLQLFCDKFTQKWEDNLDPFDHVPYGNIRRVMWQWLEEPPNARTPRSTIGKVFNVTSMSVSILSILVLVLGSLPELRQKVRTNVLLDPNVTSSPGYNLTHWLSLVALQQQHRRTDGFYYLERPIQPLYCIAVVCVVWFSMEFGWRLLVTAERKKFLCSPYGIIDLATIMPFYMELLLPYVFTGNAMEFSQLMFLVRGVRVLRAAYVFKLLRYSPALQLALYSFVTGKKEMCLFFILFAAGCLFFSITVYYVERDANTPGFESIPASMWWAVIAITMVGYGDVIPQTTAGQLMASLASIWGLLILSFPSAMVVEKGLDGWARMKRYNRRASRRMLSVRDVTQTIADLTTRKARTIRYKHLLSNRPTPTPSQPPPPQIELDEIVAAEAV